MTQLTQKLRNYRLPASTPAYARLFKKAIAGRYSRWRKMARAQEEMAAWPCVVAALFLGLPAIFPEIIFEVVGSGNNRMLIARNGRSEISICAWKNGNLLLSEEVFGSLYPT